MKKLKIEYGDSVFALPREKLTAVLASASEFNLKVLILAASDDALRADYDNACTELCRRLDCTKSALSRALEFWRQAGVMSAVDCDETAQTAVQESGKKHLQSESLPEYTESQTADIIEKNTDLSGIIDMCQQIVEKMFTSAEVQIIVGLYDHLGLDGEYIVTLFAHCEKSGKRSLRYIEKTALSLYDEGIDTASALEDYIRRRERLDENIGRLRSLIGAGSRQLTSREKKLFECWLNEWKFDIDVITRAYEVTVDRLGEYKLAYMNRILENWHKDGLLTIDAVEASIEEYQKNKSEAQKNKSGFETDEYFEAALARSQKYLEKNRSGK